MHAVQLLAELRAVEAIPDVVAALAGADPMDLLVGETLRALRAFGPAACEETIRAAQTASTPPLGVLEYLAGAGVHDPRIPDLLPRAFPSEVAIVAGLVADYGDVDLLPTISASPDASRPTVQPSYFSNGGALELDEAIERLGGTLSEPQSQKLAVVGGIRRLHSVELRDAPWRRQNEQE